MPEPASSCHTCRSSSDPHPPPRERILQTRSWRAAHAWQTALPGWLVLVPNRHVEVLDELSPEEAAELGPLLVALTAALRDVTGCVKTYVMLLAEAQGFAHVHFHVVPRLADQPASLRGPRVFDLLGVPDAQAVPAGQMDRLAERLRRRLTGQAL